jgi:AcrR family transcriptional regulator
MEQSASAASSEAENPVKARILRAAFQAFTEDGYAGTSTLAIARRAKVSKRDLYAHFGSKHAILVVCIKSRADRMRLPPGLPIPRSREMLAATITAFAKNLLRESSDPAVIAAFRLAIAEATRSPEVAQALDTAGRDAPRRALTEYLANAQAAGLLGAGEPGELAVQYLGLLWESLMVRLLLGVAAAPTPAEAAQRGEKATAAFLRLHPGPVPDPPNLIQKPTTL